ncbi:MAG: hypothetical protein ACODAJ_11510, partial [Planctomycetota bacterium]
MEPKQIGMLAVAGLLIVVAVVLVARQLGGGQEQEDPVATWVCDNCGHEADQPLENVSPNCPECEEGQ